MKLFTFFVALLFLSEAFASDVHGAVRLSQGRPAANAVVYLEGGVRPHPIQNARIDQRDRTFIPHVSVVTAGTRVAFPNHDTIYHNVFADYDAKRFDLGMYPRGVTKYVTFPKPGLVVMMCSVHPEMGAYIMVVDTPYFAVTDSHGNFSIHGVQPGQYTARVWHESGQVAVKSITVSSDTKLDLVAGRH